jgi:serine/threonine-protein kinase
VGTPSLASGSPTLAEGQRVAQYRIVRHIGTGGMAEVYEATHTGLRKRVALKVLRQDMAQREDVRRRFVYEGQAASRIRHPHVVDVTDVGTEGDVTFLVMELLEGRTLQDLLDEAGLLPVDRTVDILLPVFAALAEAHDQGVIHRDMKPDNIFLARTSQGRVIPKLVDFGISKIVDGTDLRATATTSVLGTPHYMSPEQARGERFLDARSDQFSAAMIVYECLVGGLPYVSETVVELLHEVARCQLRPPSTWIPSFDLDLEQVIMKALSHDPASRYTLIEDFAEALLPWSSERGSRAFAAARQSAVAPLSDRPPPPRGAIAPISVDVPLGPKDHSTIEQTDLPPGAPSTADSTPSASSGSAPSHSEGVGASPTPHPTPAPLGPSTTPDASTTASPTTRPSRLPLWIGLGAVMLLLLLGIGAAAGLGFWAGGTRDDAASATIEPGATEDPTPEPTTYRVATTASPTGAEIELDGETIAGGSLDRELPRDGSEHRLVIRAPAHATREILFRDTPPPTHVELEPVAEPTDDTAPDEETNADVTPTEAAASTMSPTAMVTPRGPRPRPRPTMTAMSESEPDDSRPPPDDIRLSR